MAFLRDQEVEGISSTIVDLGATLCIFHDKSFFIDFREMSYNIGTANDENAMTIQGGGTVRLQFISEDGKPTTLTLTNVAYAPDLRFNIISLSYLAEEGSFQGMWNAAGITIVNPNGDLVGKATAYAGLHYARSLRNPLVTRPRKWKSWHCHMESFHLTSSSQKLTSLIQSSSGTASSVISASPTCESYSHKAPASISLTPKSRPNLTSSVLYAPQQKR